MNRYIVVFVLALLGIAAYDPSIVQHAINNILRAFAPLFEPVFWIAVFAIAFRWLWNGGGSGRRRK